MPDSPMMTRRQFLLMKALATGVGVISASEAVASTALAHPEWDMHEQRTFAEWEDDA